MNLIESPIGKTLQADQQRWQQLHLADIFVQDKERFEKFSLTAAGLTLDYSKNLMDEQVMTHLLQLTEQAQVKSQLAKLFAGEPVNFTEKQPAWHSILRDSQQQPAEVKQAFQRAEQLVQWATAQQFKYVVNLGIGGSDLGPALVVEALAPYHVSDAEFYFVSNADPSDLGDVLERIDPQHTLFIVASKTFTTQETLVNAEVAKQWLQTHRVNPAQHMVAVTAAPARAQAFGIDATRILEFWSWVGGRYSLWSNIGFAIMLALGVKQFQQLLCGAYLMDQHTQQAPLAENMPVILALLSVWYINFWNASTLAIIPYDQHLRLLPSYLQQLVMESNGKSARNNGEISAEATAPIVWGQVGTNGQHAFHQLLHQGTHLVPIDFILPVSGHNADLEQQKLLVANCIAQSEALMLGKKSDDAHSYYPGNRPSNTILMRQLTPETLGALLALYEHKTFVEAVIWQINAFDQRGVELGKQLAQGILAAMQNPKQAATHDVSTQAQLEFYQNPR